MLLLVAALMWSMGSELLIDIWQPHALLLPFCLLVVLTIAVASGDVRLLPVWVGVASLVVQTHVAYVYVIARTGGRRHRRDRADPPPARRRILESRRPPAGATQTFLWTVVVLVAGVDPAAVGAAVRLAARATCSGSPPTPAKATSTVGAGASVKIVAAVVALPPWWTRFGYEDSVRSTPLTQTPDGPRLFVPGLPETG